MQSTYNDQMPCHIIAYFWKNLNATASLSLFLLQSNSIKSSPCPYSLGARGGLGQIWEDQMNLMVFGQFRYAE